MKTVLLFLTITFLSVSTFAQDVKGKTKKANAAFESFAYDRAIERYDELGSSTIDVMRKEALSYWRLNNTEEAELLFKDIVIAEGHNAEDELNYALILRSNGKYEESEVWMSKYANLNANDLRGSLYMREKGSYRRLLK